MSDSKQELLKIARKWFHEANANLKEMGAPSIGSPDKDASTFEESEIGKCMFVNISNIAVLSFFKPNVGPTEVILSVNRGPLGASRHKIAVLVNVLSTVSAEGVSPLRIGAPFDIVDGIMVVSENLD